VTVYLDSERRLMQSDRTVRTSKYDNKHTATSLYDETSAEAKHLMTAWWHYRSGTSSSNSRSQSLVTRTPSCLYTGWPKKV